MFIYVVGVVSEQFCLLRWDGTGGMTLRMVQTVGAGWLYVIGDGYNERDCRQRQMPLFLWRVRRNAHLAEP